MSQAKTDIRNSAIWYENKQDRLGMKLTSEVRNSFNLLKSNPYAFQIRYDKIRAALVKSFPFLIHFSIDEDSKRVIIISVFHTSMNPENWKDRYNDQNPFQI